MRRLCVLFPRGGGSRGFTRRAFSSSAFGRPEEQKRAEVKKDSHKCVRMDLRGELRVGRMTVRQLREASGAPLRDLLQLGLSETPGGNGTASWASSCILPRKSAILVHLGTMKAIISPKEALFFDADRIGVRRAVRRISEAFVASWRVDPMRASSGTPEEDPLPFELAVLEGILRELCASYARRCKLYNPIVHSSLRQLNTGGASSDEADGIEGLHRLSAFDGALSGFSSEASGAIQVVVDLLASDEDMLALLMSERQCEGELDPARHAVVELLLETYHRRLVQVAKTIAQLRQHVSSTRELARVSIDLSRNRIIRFNLYLSISTVGLATVTTVAGIFGMNLTHGLEETPGAFALVSGVSVVIGAAVCGLAQATLTHHARIDERAQSAARDRQTLESLLGNLATIELIFDEKLESPLAMGDVSRLVEKATGRPTNRRELELIFEIFDHSRDGILDNEERDIALVGTDDEDGDDSESHMEQHGGWADHQPPQQRRRKKKTAQVDNDPEEELLFTTDENSEDKKTPPPKR